MREERKQEEDFKKFRKLLIEYIRSQLYVGTESWVVVCSQEAEKCDIPEIKNADADEIERHLQMLEREGYLIIERSDIYEGGYCFRVEPLKPLLDYKELNIGIGAKMAAGAASLANGSLNIGSFFLNQ